MRRMICGGLGVGLMAFVVVLLLALTPSCAAMSFTSNVRVDNGSSFSYDPVVIVNSTGVIFSVWADYRNLANNDIYLAKSTNNGQSFTGDVRVDDSAGGDQLAPDMAVEDDDTLHVVWQDRRGSSDDVYYSKSVNGGSSFGANKRVDNSASGQQRNPALVLYENDIYVVWEDTRNGNYDIYFSKSTDNGSTWSSDLRVDNTGAGASDQRFPDIAVDSSGDIFVVWQDTRDTNNDIYFASSTNGGTSFNTNIRVDDTGSGSSDQVQPAIGVDGDDDIHVVWHDDRNSDDDIYYCNSTTGGASFNSDIRVDDSSSGNQRFPAIAVDINDIVHVAWQDYRGGANPDIYHSNMTESGSFDTNAHVDDGLSTTQQRYPDITTDDNANIFIVWEDDRGTNEDIYFSKNSNSQPYPPTMTAPANNGWLITNTPTFTWTFSDPDPSDSQTAFKLQVLNGAVVIYDSGNVLSGTSSHTTTVPLSDGSWTWKVRVRDSNGAWSSYNSTWVIKIDTSIPTANTPSDAGAWSKTSSVLWTWTSSSDTPSGIDGYYVCIGTLAGGCDVVSDGWAPTNQYTYNGGVEGTTYYAKLKAKDVAGNVGAYGGDSDGVTVDTQAPTTAVPTDDGQWSNSTSLIWSWTDSTDTVSGVLGYYVCVGTAAGSCDVVNDEWTISSSYTFNGANNAQTYYAKVKSKDNAGNVGSYSGNSDGITVDTVPPTAGRPVDDGDYTSLPNVKFIWASSVDSVSGIQGYYVSVGTLPGGNDVVKDMFVTQSNYTYANGQNGETYYAIVRAVDNASNIGQPSLSSDGITVDMVPPAAPTVYDEGITNDTTRAKGWWDAVEDLESGLRWYHVGLINHSGTGPPIISADTTLTSYTFTDLDGLMVHGEDYFIVVWAIDNAGGWSQAGESSGFWVDTEVNASEPARHDGLYSNSTAIVWTWPEVVDVPAGVDGYYVSIGTFVGGSNVLSEVWTTTNGYTFTGGTNGATYYITVVTVDKARNRGAPVSNATGVLVDNVPPRVSMVIDAGPYSPTTNITFNWTGYPDSSSGIAFYEIAIGSTPYGQDILIAISDIEGYVFTGAETGRTYYAKARAIDNAGNIGDWGISSDGIAVDLTGPSDIELVRPGAFINTKTYLDLEWTASTDTLSGIMHYTYCIGSFADGCDVVDLTNVVETATRVEGLALQNGNRYFISIQAVNGAGIGCQAHTSEVVIDTMAPTAPTIIDYREFQNSNAITVSWSGATDDRAGVMGYYISVGSDIGLADLVNRELVTGKDHVYGSGIHGKAYYITIVTVDNAWNEATPVMVGPIIVDLIPPQVTAITRAGEYSHTFNITWNWIGSDSTSGIDEYSVWVNDINIMDTLKVSEPWFSHTEGLLEGNTYCIKLRPKDRAGNWGDHAYGECITIDTIPPSAKVTIDNNATYVRTRAVTVQVQTAPKDVSHMLIGNIPTLAGSTWEPFTPSRLWYLTPGDGVKDVYVAIKDASGQVSPTYRVTVILDTELPKLDLDLPGDVVSSSTLTIKGKTEPGAVVTVNEKEVKVDPEGNFESEVSLDEGTNLITVVTKDEAGNEVKVTKAINRESFSLPSSALLGLLLIMMVIAIVALGYALSVNKKIKAYRTDGPPRERKATRRPEPDRTVRRPPRERSRSKREEPAEEEEEEEEEDIISRIRAKEDDELTQLKGAEDEEGDEITLERGEVEDETSFSDEEEGLDLDEEFEEGEEELELDEEIEMDEAPRTPVARVRCSGCGEVIPIFSTERPLKIQCSECGTMGMLKR